MWQRVNNFIRQLFIIFLVIIGGTAYSKGWAIDSHNHITVLEKDKSFSAQIFQKNMTYVIRDDFDLRERVNGTVIDKSFNYKNKKYYRNRVLISLCPGQGIWVPDGVMIFSKTLDSILSNNSYYLPLKEDSIYLCSNKSRTISYMISGIVTMPEDCVLQFEGGVLNNGIIRSVRTQIQSPPKQIFGNNMFFGWYWDITEAYPEWFGAKGDKSCDDGVAIQKCLDSFKKARLVNHQYYSSTSICIPAHGSLVGSGKYQTTISYTKSLECMIFTETGFTLTDLLISNVNLNKTDSNIIINRGISIQSATGSKIESVYVSGANVGYALNSFFCSQIKGCVAYGCNIGFYLGSDGGSCTTIDYDNCYANKCVTGHLFRNSNYVTTKNTAADYCETAYDFVESVVTLMSPGAECCKFFIKVVPHSDISRIGNYAHNNIHIINGQSIYNELNKEGVIYIATDTRGYKDRNRIVIEGFNIYFKDNSFGNILLHKKGDTVLHLNNVSSYVQPNSDAINYYRDGVASLQKTSSLKYWTDKVVGTSVFIRDLHRQVFWDGSNWVDSNGVTISYK